MIWFLSVIDSVQEWVLEMAFVIKDQQFPGQTLEGFYFQVFCPLVTALSTKSCIFLLYFETVMYHLVFALCRVLMISPPLYIPPFPLSLSSIHPTWRWVCDFFLFCFIWGFLFRFVFKPPPTAPFLFNPVPLHVDLPPGTLCPRNSGFFCTAFWDAPRAEDSHESGPSQLVQNGHRQQETVPEPQEELADWISLPPGLPLWFRTLTGLNTHRKAGVCWSRHTFHRAAHFMIFMNSLHFFDSFF